MVGVGLLLSMRYGMPTIAARATTPRRIMGLLRRLRGETAQEISI